MKSVHFLGCRIINNIRFLIDFIAFVKTTVAYACVEVEVEEI